MLPGGMPRLWNIGKLGSSQRYSTEQNQAEPMEDFAYLAAGRRGSRCRLLGSGFRSHSGQSAGLQRSSRWISPLLKPDLVAILR